MPYEERVDLWEGCTEILVLVVSRQDSNLHAAFNSAGS